MITRRCLHLLPLLAFASHLLAAAPDSALPKCHTDWKVEIVAEHPQVNYSSALCVAPDGRVFVGQDPMDMALRGDEPRDSILCFHPDGKVTVFATNLYAVFGLAYLDGKLYVHQCPKFTVFTDDHGVGQDPVDLFSTNPNPSNGGGLNDHIPANMRLAMDGYFYMAIGDKGVFSAVGRDGSKAELHGGGVIRFRPDGTHLEVFTTGTRNHLDVAINAEDEVFTYDNTDDGNGWWTRVTHHMDGGYYGYPYDYQKDPTFGVTEPSEATKSAAERNAPNRPKQSNPIFLRAMTDYGGGSPTGAIAYNEDALPPEYHGNLFFSEWGRKQLLRLRVSHDGATFKVAERVQQDGLDFLSAGTKEFRPIGLGWSPDGLSLYVADWNVSGWKKPDEAGRLLKVTYTGTSQAKPKPAWWLPAAMGQPFSATTEELVEGLKHPAQSVRLVAQRRLAERGDEALVRVSKLITDTKSPAYARWSAIWTVDALFSNGRIKEPGPALDAIYGSLKDSDDTVRMQTIRWIGTRMDGKSSFRVGPFLKDPNPAVRFQAAVALGRMFNEEAAKELIKGMDEQDSSVRFAVFTSLNHLANEKRSAWADRSSWNIIAEQLYSSNAAVRETALLAMREAYDETNVKALARFISSPKATPETRAATLAVLAELHRQRPAWDGKWWATQPVKSPPLPKTVEWAATPLVLASVRASITDASPLVRRAGIAAVETTGDRDSASALRTAFARETDVEIQKTILRTLGTLKDTASGALVAGVLNAPDRNAALLTEAIAAAGQIADQAMVVSLVKLLDLARQGSAQGQALPASEIPVATLRPFLPAILKALGESKSSDAVPPLVKLVKSSDSETRPLANAALQQIGGGAVASAVLPLMDEPDLELRRLAIATIGSLKDKKLIPELLKAHQNKDTRDAAVLALTQMPDLAALDVFLESIDDKNSTLRTPVYNAMKGLADKALPVIEERHRKEPFARGQLGALQRLYERNTTARNGVLFEGAAKAVEPEAYVKFAENHKGEAGRGKKLFNDANGVACVKCHKAGGKEGGEVGPDLTGVGSKYNRSQLIEAVIYPSKQILDGYHQTQIVLRNEDEFSGIIRQETADAITLVDTEGKLHTVRPGEIRSKKESALSLMPEGLQLGLSLQDFADLASYLESLKEKTAAKK